MADTPAAASTEVSTPVADTPAAASTEVTTPVPDTAALAEPGERGTLTVKDRVVERIATQAMSTTDGVATGSSGLARRNVSRVRVSNNNSRVRAQAEIGVQWPRSAADVAAHAHENITRHLADAGVAAQSVDVRVTSVQQAAPADESENVSPTTELVAGLPPRARPAAAPVAVVISFVLVALGVVAVRDSLVYANAISGEAWTGWVVDRADGLTAQTWMLAGGIAVAVVGLLVVIAALKPRAKRFRPADAADTWVRKDDVRTLVRHAVADVPGVESAQVTVKKKTAKVRVVGVGGDTLRSSVEDAASGPVGVLDGSPSVAVSVKAVPVKPAAVKRKVAE